MNVSGGKSLRGRILALLLTGLSVFALGLLSSRAPGYAGVGQEPAEGGKKQDDGDDKANGKTRKGGLRVPAGNAPRDRQRERDPLPPANGQPNGNAAPKGADNAPAANVPRIPKWPFHYTLKISGADDQPVQIAYYPAENPFQAPVLMLVHETGTGRSSKDFEEAIEDLKGKSLIQSLQAKGYALLTIDLRGHGGNPRVTLTDQASPVLVGDLQAAYYFLVDRHNRGELNLGKLGVIALGDAANVALAWAAMPGGGVSSEGRLSDLGGFVLISPTAETHGLAFTRLLPQVAARFPILAMSGDKDEKSVQVLLDNARVIERHRLSRVAYFNTTLHGNKLLTFFPKVASGATSFLEDPVFNRKLDWEPRFLLTPVVTDDAHLVADSGYTNLGQVPPANNGNANRPANDPAPRAAEKKK